MPTNNVTIKLSTNAQDFDCDVSLACSANPPASPGRTDPHRRVNRLPSRADRPQSHRLTRGVSVIEPGRVGAHDRP